MRAPRGGAEIQTTATFDGVLSPETRNAVVQNRGEKRVSKNDGRADLDEAQLETAKRAAEHALEILRQSNKRVSSSVGDGFEKRARGLETRGSKRRPEDDGRADLDDMMCKPFNFPSASISHISSSRWCDMVDGLYTWIWTHVVGTILW